MAGALTAHDTRSSDEIRQDIEINRTQMDHTLVALQQKLSSRGVVDQAREIILDSSKRARLFQTLRVSPAVAAIAAASLAGAGASITYLLALGADEEALRRREARRYVERLPAETAGGRLVEPGQELRGGLGGRLSSLVHRWRGRARETRGKLQEKAEQAKREGAEKSQELQGMASERWQEAKEKATRARHRASEAGQKATEAARHALHRTRQIGSENPLATAAAGVAAGVLLGVLLPGWPERHEKGQPRARRKGRGEGKECFEKAEQQNSTPAEAPVPEAPAI